jgi:hypothetical protein
MAAQGNALSVGLQPVVVMLEKVAFKKKMFGPAGDAWVEAVRSKFADVGVLSLRGFVQNVLKSTGSCMTRAIACYIIRRST